MLMILGHNNNISDDAVYFAINVFIFLQVTLLKIPHLTKYSQDNDKIFEWSIILG